MRTQAFEENDVAASCCRDELYYFLQEFWEDMVPVPMIPNWHMKYLCDEIQEVIERIMRGDRKLYDLIINISPGTTKSTIVSVAAPAWAWTRSPAFRSICGSHTQALALSLSQKCRDVIKSARYQTYFPHVQIRGDQDAKSEFATMKKGFRIAVGVEQSVIGRHAELLNVDDPIDPQAAISDAELKNANDWMDALAQRAGNKKTTTMILTMQRLAQHDPTGYWRDKNPGKIKDIIIPAIVTDKIQPPELVHCYVNGLMDPDRLDLEVLEEARVRLGDVKYAGQYLQHPVPPGGVMFDITKIRRNRSRPPDSHFVEFCRFWDKASTDGGGDYTAGVLIGKDKEGYFWFLDVWRFQIDSGTREKRIRARAEMDGTGVLVGLEQEPAGSGKDAADATLRLLAGFRVRKETAVGDKTLRADTMSQQVNNGNFYIPTNAGEWVNAFLEEMMYFPFSKYDDQIDAASGAFTLLARPRARCGAI